MNCKHCVCVSISNILPLVVEEKLNSVRLSVVFGSRMRSMLRASAEGGDFRISAASDASCRGAIDGCGWSFVA